MPTNPKSPDSPTRYRPNIAVAKGSTVQREDSCNSCHQPTSRHVLMLNNQVIRLCATCANLLAVRLVHFLNETPSVSIPLTPAAAALTLAEQEVAVAASALYSEMRWPDKQKKESVAALMDTHLTVPLTNYRRHARMWLKADAGIVTVRGQRSKRRPL